MEINRMSIDKLIEQIKKDYIDERFLNYIEYIQFPKYKNLEENTHIDF